MRSGPATTGAAMDLRTAHIGRRTAETLMKILMSALACEPGKGSELEVGFQAMLAAARQHDVWVLTNKDTLPAVARAIEDRPERGADSPRRGSTSAWVRKA